AGSASMSSENYNLSVDAISVGGDLGTSTNYQVSNTVGESPGIHDTPSTSTNYIIEAGFQAAASGVVLSAALSTNSVSLGTLSTGAVSTASQTLTVTTNSPTGYTATIADDGNLRSGANDINDVSDGTVTAGSEEYGIRTSGTAGQMNNSDTAITAVAQTVASTSTIATSEQTSIAYKVGVSASTESGTYSHTVTFTTTVNY
ncbi:MAG: hypothetical protein HZC05_03715, partial [Candidatus Magasanikbacteria bacterium]|nr:hypothetical protein [Candidatus Magasanikbacteria bacterium]